MFIIVRNIFIILVPWYILSLDIGGLHLKASEIVLIILSMLSLKNLRVSKTIQKISIIFIGMIAVVMVQALISNSPLTGIEYTITHVILLLIMLQLSMKYNYSVFLYAKYSLFITLGYGIISYAAYSMFGISINMHHESSGVRLQSLFTDPNRYANYLVVFWPFIFIRNNQTRITISMINSLAIVVIFISIVLTASRGGIIAFIISLIYTFTYLARENQSKPFKHLSKVMYIGIVIYMLINMYEIYYTRSVRIDSIDSLTNNIRFGLWNDGFLQFKQSPILGLGFGNLFSNNRLIFEQYELHNTLLTVLLQGGALYSGLFISFIAIVIKMNKVMRRNNSIIKDDTINMFMISYLGLVTHSMFINIHIERYIWMLIAINISYYINWEYKKLKY